MRYVESSLITTHDGTEIPDEYIARFTSYYQDDYQGVSLWGDLLLSALGETPPQAAEDVTVTFQFKRYAPDVAILTTIVDSPREVEPDESSSVHDADLWHITVWPFYCEVDDAPVAAAGTDLKTFQDWIWH